MTQRVYYSIKEVSERLGVPYSTLRYWENIIPELKPHRNEGKTRFYTEQDIALLEQIKYLREEQHFSVKAIQKHLLAHPQTVDKNQQLTRLLQQIRQELVELKSMI